jgi:hypothetical protein
MVSGYRFCVSTARRSHIYHEADRRSRCYLCDCMRHLLLPHKLKFAGRWAQRGMVSGARLTRAINLMKRKRGK